MRVSDSEGVANHAGPESWRAGRETRLQALTGERAGRVLSNESSWFGVLTAFPCSEGNTGLAAHCEARPDPAESKTPCTHGNTLHGTREIQALTLPCWQGPHGESERNRPR